MTTIRRRAVSLLFMLVSAALTTPPGSAKILYHVQSIAPSPDGSGEARAVNSGGDVVGEFEDAAFIWHAGQFISFPAIRRSLYGLVYKSIATTINREGLAAGRNGSDTPCLMSGLKLATAATFHAGAKLRLLNSPDNAQCGFEADGINDRGTIVGVSGYRGFVRYSNGRELVIQPLSRRSDNNGTRATAINDEGHVIGGTTVDVAHVPLVEVGEQSWPGGEMRPIYGPDQNAYVIHAFLLTIIGMRQRMLDLGAIKGYPDTLATALNNNLTVVGFSGDRSGPKWTRVSGSSHAWVWQYGHMADISAGHGNSFAYGVNDADTIVGCSGDDAVRWINKRVQNLNALIDPHSGWHLTCARGINRNGVIVGSGSFRGSKQLPFRLVPYERH